MSNRLFKATDSKGSGLLNRLYHYSALLTDLITCIYLLMIIVILPLYTKLTYASIGSDKRALFLDFMQLYWKLALPLLVLQLILHILVQLKIKNTQPLALLKKWKQSFTGPDLWVLGYMLVVALSWLLSDYRDIASLGNEKWTMGALTQLSLGGGYFLITRLWKKRAHIFFFMLPVSALLFLLGYLNRFNIWPIPMKVHSNPQFISLAGNINWYCGYLVTVLFFGVYLVWSDAFSRRWQRCLMALYLFLGFAALVTNGSSSGILTLLGVFLILLLLSVKQPKRLERYCDIALILSLSCLLTLCIRLAFPEAITYQETTNDLFTYTALPVVLLLLSLGMKLWLVSLNRRHAYPLRLFQALAYGLAALCGAALLLFVFLLTLNTLIPGSIGPLSSYSFFTFSPEWGSRRGATWMAGFLAWKEQSPLKKLIGIGPDCMGDYITYGAGTSLRELVASVWSADTVLSNAHCEWLTVLVNLGVLGLLCFAGMIISAVRGFLRRGAEESAPFHCLVGACGLAILAYSVHNIVSFQQVLNEPAMFVILGVGAAYCRESSSDKA